MAYCGVNNLVYPRERKIIFRENFIKISEVDAHTPLAAFLQDHNNVGQPFRILHILDESNFEQPVYLFYDDLMSFFMEFSQFLLNWVPFSLHVQVVASY